MAKEEKVWTHVDNYLDYLDMENMAEKEKFWTRVDKYLGMAKQTVKDVIIGGIGYILFSNSTMPIGGKLVYNPQYGDPVEFSSKLNFTVPYGYLIGLGLMMYAGLDYFHKFSQIKHYMDNEKTIDNISKDVNSVKTSIGYGKHSLHYKLSVIDSKLGVPKDTTLYNAVNGLNKNVDNVKEKLNKTYGTLEGIIKSFFELTPDNVKKHVLGAKYSSNDKTEQDEVGKQ